MKVCTHNGELKGIPIVCNTSDHCPPHLHVDGDDWIARFEFSFVDNEVKLMDIVPEQANVTAPVISSIVRAIKSNISRARELWWGSISSTCIDNMLFDLKGVCITDNGGKKIANSRYIAEHMTTFITMSDGSKVEIKHDNYS